MQDFIVAWVNGEGEDKFRNFESLKEAEVFMGQIYSPESYVYLSIVIKVRQLTPLWLSDRIAILESTKLNQEAIAMNKWIGQEVTVEGLTIVGCKDISKVLTIESITEDETVFTCGHVLENWSGDKTLTNKNNRRVMLCAQIR